METATVKLALAATSSLVDPSPGATDEQSTPSPASSPQSQNPIYVFDLHTVLSARIPTSKYVRNPLRLPLNSLYHQTISRFNAATTAQQRVDALLHVIAIPKCVLRDPIPRKEARRSSKTVTRDIQKRIERALADDWIALFSEAAYGFDRNLPLADDASNCASDDAYRMTRPLQPALPVDPDMVPAPEQISEMDIRRTVRRLNSSSPPGCDGLRTAHLKALLSFPGMRQQPQNAISQLTLFVMEYAKGSLLASVLPACVGDLFCNTKHCRDHMGCALPILHLACCCRVLKKGSEVNHCKFGAAEGNTVQDSGEEEDEPVDNLKGTAVLVSVKKEEMQQGET